MLVIPHALVTADQLPFLIIASRIVLVIPHALIAADQFLPVIASRVMLMVFRVLIAADHIPFFVVTVRVMFMTFSAAADQMSFFVVTAQTVKMRHIMATDHVPFFVVTVIPVYMKAGPRVQALYFLLRQFHRLEAQFIMNMLFQLRNAADRDAAFFQDAVLVKAVLVVAAVVMGMQLQFTADQRLLFFIALRGMAVPRRVLRLLFRADQFPALLIAGIRVFMSLQSADLFLFIAGVRMFMFFFTAGQFLLIAAAVMFVILAVLFADQRFLITAVCMYMLALLTYQRLFLTFVGVLMFLFFTDQIALIRSIAVVRMDMPFLLFRLLLPADKNFFLLVTTVLVFMDLAFLQRAYQLPVCVAAVVIMRMNHVICITAHKFPVFPAVFRMFMQFIRTVQNLYFMRHRLAVQFQSRHCSQCDNESQTQKNRKPALIFFLLLQKSRSL